MEDLDASEVFLAEAQDLQASIERNLLDLAARPDDRGLIDALFRELHTLKGSSAMFGFADLSRFIHEFETAFEALRGPEGCASAALVQVALAACDHVGRLLSEPQGAESLSAAILADLNAALGGAETVAESGAETGAEKAPEGFDFSLEPDPAAQINQPAAARQGGWRVQFALRPQALSLGVNPFALLRELRDLAPDTVQIQTDLSNFGGLEHLDPLHPALRFSLTLPACVTRAQLDDVFLFVTEELVLEIAELAATGAGLAPQTAPQQPAALPVEQAPAQPATAAWAQSPAAPQTSAEPSPEPLAKPASSMRVPTERLDALMDRVGELVIAEARLNEIALRLKDQGLAAAAEDIRRLTAGLRETTMTIRMVPLGSLFARFRRLIHDLSARLGRPIELITEGGETELDKTVIETLADPLVHMLRNSADHGIESPETRAAMGKAPMGRITLSARQAGAEVLITIADDGRGLDLDRIRARAIERGIVAQGASLTEAECRMLIFAAGFSTAETVTELSGRGVGMDVVRATIESLRGRIEVASEPGFGTQITLRLPLTLAIIDGLLVEVGRERYTIPLAAIEECVELPSGFPLDGPNFLPLRGQLVPFLRLSQLFGAEGPSAPFQKVIVVGSSLGRTGLVVDRIISTNQTVIKQLSRLHAGLRSFSGATILGDGSVALILDTGSLIAEGRRLEDAARAIGRVA